MPGGRACRKNRAGSLAGGWCLPGAALQLGLGCVADGGWQGITELERNLAGLGGTPVVVLQLGQSLEHT
jgi:hypothetical protein